MYSLKWYVVGGVAAAPGLKWAAAADTGTFLH